VRYTNQPRRRRWPKRLLILLSVGLVLIVGATVGVRYVYNKSLGPVNNDTRGHLVTIEQGATVNSIASLLQSQHLIRNAWAFRLYVSSKEVRNELQAGSYEFASSQSVPEIVSQLTRGKVATDLVTILPGLRLDQVRRRFEQAGFKDSDITAAFDPSLYADNPALVDKPANASLEGYLYPESYQKTGTTNPSTIVTAALAQMNKRLTPDLRNAFAQHGLSTYQAVILASVVEMEVPKQTDRDQVAQVMLKRLSLGMPLQSDATATYGAVLVGATPSNSYPSAYNTYLHTGLPPTPISNVTASSLQAVANPAPTDWLYFVSGDDGTTHFAKTLADQEANIAQYCKRLCAQ